MNSTDRLVKQCANGSFCCAEQNNTCCDDGDGLWIDTSNYQLKNFNPALVNNTSNATIPSDTPAIVGGAVGGVAGLLLVLGIAWFLWRRRRSARKSGEAEDGAKLQETVFTNPGERVEMDGNDERTRASELQGSGLQAENVELEGTSVLRELEDRQLVEEAGDHRSFIESDNRHEIA